MIMDKRNKNERSGAPNESCKESWVKLPREITTSSELNPYQFRMLALLMDRENYFNTSWFWCSMGWLVAHTGMKRTKAKETLQELKEKGFISITSHKDTRKPSHFHINWRFINAYHGPKTQEELELDEIDIAVSDSVRQSTATATTSLPAREQKPRCKYNTLSQYQESAWRFKMHTPDMRKSMGAPEMPPPENPLPAKEWYETFGRHFMRETHFPKVLELQQSKADKNAFNNCVKQLLQVAMAYVAEDNDEYVWCEVIKPDYEEYKKEQISDGQGL